MMTKAFENAAKLYAWADPVAFGADPTGIAASDTAFALARNTGLPVRIPKGSFRLSNPLAVSLSTGQDFVLVGDGPEVSRIVFDGGAGISLTYNGALRSFGDATSIIIDGIGIETIGSGGDAIKLLNTATVVNDTEANVRLSNLSISGAASANWWANAISMQNVAFPHLSGIKVEDGQRRTVALSLATAGGYSAVDITVSDFKCWEPLTAIKVRGSCEGLYLNQFVAIGCTTGVDWVASIGSGGGKKPLLLLDGCHINTSGTAIKTTDVAQILASASLIYIANSAANATFGFDFQASNGLSSENSRIDGVTIIGQGSRAGSQAVAVRCGTNVFGVAIDATIDNVGTCVATEENNRTTIASSSRLSNYNVRSVGMYNVGGVAGGESGGVSVDGSLQMETIGADSYSRDVYREQIRSRSFIFEATASSETVMHTLALPFRTDTSMLLASFGADPGDPASFMYPDLPLSSATQLAFKTSGLTPGAPYRINYIAYGY